jgi:hypothetical protein
MQQPSVARVVLVLGRWPYGDVLRQFDTLVDGTLNRTLLLYCRSKTTVYSDGTAVSGLRTTLRRVYTSNHHKNVCFVQQPSLARLVLVLGRWPYRDVLRQFNISVDGT